MLSVVIPCHNNHDTLPWILQSLRSSRLPGLEVVCVDDASTHSLSAVTEQHGARLIRLEGPPGRRALARNQGHEGTTNPLTLYLDGDVIPDPQLPWIAVRLHKANERVAIKYPVYGIPPDVGINGVQEIALLILRGERDRVGRRVTKSVSIDTRPLPRRLRGKRTKIWQLCASHCLSVERKCVAKVGGWDTSFVGWGEEDLELAYRLHLSGVDFIYPHRRLAAAYHIDHPVDWESNLASLRSNIRYFRKKFPEAWPARLPLLRHYLRQLDLGEVDVAYFLEP